MKLTAKARCAVTSMADLAAFSDGKTTPLSVIAERQVISLSFLEQVFRKLKNAGLVESRRGVAGGYVLVHPASDIRVSDIVRAVDEPIRTTACVPGETVGCRGTTARCLTHDLWDQLGRHIEVFLESVTLADVIEKNVLGRAVYDVPVTNVGEQVQ